MQTSKLSVSAVSQSGANQVNRDALGYLVTAPVNVITNVAAPDNGWSVEPATLPGAKALYSTRIQVLSSVSNASLHGQNLEVDASTCYTPPRGTSQSCVTGSIVRSGVDLSQVAPDRGLTTRTVACNGVYSSDNQCTPSLDASLASDGTTATVSVIGQQLPRHSIAPAAP